MRAFYIDGPGKTRFGTTEAPVLGAGDILLRVERIGLCGSDLNTYRGRNPLVSYPRIPGHEIAATIVETGVDVPERFTVCQAVTLNPYKNCGNCPACVSGRINACRNNQTMGVQREGALTDLIAVPWQRIVTSTVSDLNHLALIEPMAVGFHAVSRAEVAKGETVAVFGCGAIGLGVIAGCVRRGAEVVAIDIDDDKLAVAKKVGAAHTINSRNTDIIPTLYSLTENRGVPVAIEAVGLAETFTACVDVVAPVGRVVYIGYANTPVTYETKLILTKELDVMGSRGALQQDFEDVVNYVESGAYPCDETITKVFPFSQANQALELWDEAPSKVTKLIVSLSEEDAYAG